MYIIIKNEKYLRCTKQRYLLTSNLVSIPLFVSPAYSSPNIQRQFLPTELPYISLKNLSEELD